MKLSKSKLALAKVINGNGGWPEWAEWSCQINWNDPKVVFSRKTKKPYRRSGWGGWAADSGILEGGFLTDKKINNWHQCLLSREEYYQAYPKAGADGWVEWNGVAKSPVGKGVAVDVKMKNGAQHFGQLIDDECWGDHWGDASIIAYRPHKQEVKPEFCESVMRSIPGSESIDELCAKVTEENKHQHVDAKPTIEQLAQDYSNKLDFASRKRKEADDAKADADAVLGELERAGEAIGLLIGVAKLEPELVITDWRDLRVGDEVECINDNIGNKYSGVIGVVQSIDYDDVSTPVCVGIDGVGGIWCHNVKFIRRP